MSTRILIGSLAILLAAITIGTSSAVRADEADATKAAGILGSLWALPKEEGKLTLLLAGKPEPVSTLVNGETIIAGICQDCSLPLKFKPGESAKKCSVCGCSVSNAACILGKPVKDGTWQTMLRELPRGVGLRPTFNTLDKPESGLKKLVVDLRSVLLPITGMDAQTPDQLLVLVKPLDGDKAELVDGGKRLSIHLKSDWTVAREVKLEKSLAKLNAKVDMPEVVKPTP